MFKLDEAFLTTVGLGGLPPAIARKVLQNTYNELEMRVGEQLTEGMSDEQLEEFGCFIDQNEPGMSAWFAEYLPDYADRMDYQGLKGANPDAPETAVMSEFGAMKWLQFNRPDYPQVVDAMFKELQQELADHSEDIWDQVKDK